MAKILALSLNIPAYEPEPATWDTIKQSNDRETWIGRACTEELPGGGNADNDGDRDPIESMPHAAFRIAGPEGVAK